MLHKMLLQLRHRQMTPTFRGPHSSHKCRSIGFRRVLVKAREHPADLIVRCQLQLQLHIDTARAHERRIEPVDVICSKKEERTLRSQPRARGLSLEEDDAAVCDPTVLL